MTKMYKYYWYLDPDGDEIEFFFDEEEKTMFESANPLWQRTYPGGPMIVTGTGSKFKTDSEFKSLLKKVKKGSPGNKIDVV
jgi:hypothetical protein